MKERQKERKRKKEEDRGEKGKGSQRDMLRTFRKSRDSIDPHPVGCGLLAGVVLIGEILL